MTTRANNRASADLAIEKVRIESVTANRRNLRKHTARQIDQIAQSVQSFGFNVPILVDRNNVVIAGHGRLAAARKLGLQEIPVVRLEHLSETQARAFMIADNQLTELSTWDDALLNEALKELAVVDLGFSIEVMGFTAAEINLRIETSEPTLVEDSTEPTPASGNTPPVTQRGDQWVLGRHVIRCDDALQESTYNRLLQGAKAAMVFADPPYNVAIDGHASGLGKVKHREFAMASGEMTREEFESFLTTNCRLLAQHSAPASIHYICMDWRHLAELLAAGNDAYGELKNICVWCKSNAGMGSFYRSQHELVLVYKSGGGRHRNNVQLGRFGRNRTNVWHYPSANDFSRAGDDAHILQSHPTPKPVQMIADAMLDCSARGDIVLDPFLGSGSTLMAAERVGRICRGIEIDPAYVDLAIRRWQNSTRKSATHAVSGKIFNDNKGE